MSIAKERIENAYKWVMSNRPKVNGFPYLAEVLRQAGVKRYVYNLPSCQCIYFTEQGQVAGPSHSLISGLSEVPQFDKEAFLGVLRASQNGDIEFLQFLKGIWAAGVINYEADLIGRKVTYFGAEGDSYAEDYPAVEVKT